MRRMSIWVLAFGLFGGGCSSEDCTAESCSSGASYQSCVDGDDFVVKTASGSEYSRCTTDYEKIGDISGEDKNNCKDKHARSKLDYCAGADSGSTLGGGSTPMGGSSSGTPGGGGGKVYCSKAKDNSSCACFNRPPEVNADYVTVSSCSTAAGLVKPICCSDSGGSGSTQCNCMSDPKACREKGDSCSCPETAGVNNTTRGNLSEVVSSCSKTAGRICCLSDSFCTCGKEQYSGAGCIGFGGVNESAIPVTSCTAPAKPTKVCQARPELTSCDGLKWAP